jgi:hypothetical protein
MPATELEVLHTLREYAEQPKSPGEWAKVYARGAHCDLHLFAMTDETFRGALRSLELKGFYRSTDDDHGWVRM